MEPARFGCNIVHGPHVQNFIEVYKLLEKNKISNKFYSVDQLFYLLNQSFIRKENHSNKIVKLKKIGSNILEKTFSEINYFL